MINGFEFETQPLNDYEQHMLLQVFVETLKLKIGKDKAVKNYQIVEGLTKRGYKINETRVRKLINHIRTNSLVPGLMATSEGYYIATSEEELVEYEESLKGREDAIRAVRFSIIRQRKQMFPRVEPTLF